MDFIQEHNEINSTYVNRRLTRDSQDLINKFVEKPHALFYRNERRGLTKTMPVLYNNLTLDITTEPSSTILDWVYDHNLTTTEDMLFGTEMFVTSEFENVTDITLFDKKSTTEKPKLIPKKSTKDLKCDCNILYKTCDINCCCDTDCSGAEKSLFIHNCRNQVCQGPDNKILRSCYSHSACENKITPHFLENLFCISKSNLPDRCLTDIQFDEAAIYRHPRWHIGERQQALYEFKNNVYKYNDPIWLINNKSIYYADIPVPISNHYCSGRKPIKFLVNENINCIVRLNDLHMFQVLKTIEGNVLSPVGTFNTTIKQNASVFYHTNWTVLSCNEHDCFPHNKSRDDPICTDMFCNNIASSVHYNFYYSNSKIIKAVIKLKMEQVPMRIPFIPQTIKVKFYLSNESADRIIKLSGNPGYNWNLPIIVSSAEGNHTFHFFNRSEGIQKILKYPDNKKGRCVLSNITYKVVQFGENKRNTCRFELKQKIDLNNGTRTCKFIQNLIISLFGLNSTLFVSPYGNPQHLNDKDWIPIKIFDKTHIYGVFKKKSSQLICYNLITRIAYIVSYAVNSVNAKAENKILHINIEGTAQNVTFDLEDATTPLTIDTNFIDTSRRLFQYAGPPHLNLYLPKSFFLPSNGNRIRNEMCLTLILLLLNPLIES